MVAVVVAVAAAVAVVVAVAVSVVVVVGVADVVRRAARTDLNQGEIVRALKAAGASVSLLHRVGEGVPDLLVGWKGVNLLLEVKGLSGKLTPAQGRWHDEWEGRVHVVRTAVGALALLHGVEDL